MIALSDVRDRLDAMVPALKDRVDFVAALAAMLEADALPQKDVFAFIAPLGLDDRGGDSLGSIHTQMLSETIGIVLCIKARGDAAARKAIPTLEELRADVLAALAGWGPDNVAGVLRVTRGRLVSISKGLVIYQLEFEVLDQLRNPR